jgi:small-conductance mechanosensitive channel
VILDQVYFQNSVKQWLYAVGILIGCYIILRVAFSVVRGRLKKISQKTKTDIDDLIVHLLEKVKFFFLFFISVYVASYFLKLPANLSSIIGKLTIIVFLLQGAIWGNSIIRYWVDRYKKQKMTEDAASVTTFTALGFVLQLILWSGILLLSLDNLGVDITALVAGLGVGGIAIALAVQSILGDLFASLSIVLDKPFVIGDFIIVDNFLGSVEHIGLKTTRLRSLSGEQLVFSNTDLLKSRIRNYKRMYERRVLFAIGVVYQTSLEALKAIPEYIRTIIEKEELVRFDRAHFKGYGDFSLNFEIVFWVKSPDYNVYMDIQQRINLEIFKKFQEENIEFAYPTQTLFVNRENQEEKN